METGVHGYVAADGGDDLVPVSVAALGHLARAPLCAPAALLQGVVTERALSQDDENILVVLAARAALAGITVDSARPTETRASQSVVASFLASLPPARRGVCRLASSKSGHLHPMLHAYSCQAERNVALRARGAEVEGRSTLQVATSSLQRTASLLPEQNRPQEVRQGAGVITHSVKPASLASESFLHRVAGTGRCSCARCRGGNDARDGESGARGEHMHYWMSGTPRVHTVLYYST